MNNLFRKYNQNRKTIWAVIIIVAFFVILLQVIFGLIRSSREKMWQQAIEEGNKQLQNGQVNEVGQGNSVRQENTVPNNNSSNYIREQYRKTAQNILNQFVEYCNQNQIEEAYNMLTTDCKQVLFPTVNDFRQNYVSQVFREKRTAKVEESMYEDGIYKVSYLTDVLASGGNSNNNILQDYIRITKEEKEDKISINKFLYQEVINKTIDSNSIYMKLIQKQAYTDYEIYQIQITNQTNQSILVSKDQKVYMLDERQVEYPSNMDEQAMQNLIVEPQKTTILNIKFNKMYNEERKTQAIYFTDIVTNYEQTLVGQEAQITGIRIDL